MGDAVITLDTDKSLAVVDDFADHLEAQDHGTYSRPLGEFMAAEFPEVEELVPGLFAVGAHTLGSAPRGLGKSQFATTWSVSIAAGQSTMPGFEVSRRAAVLYLDGEMPPKLMQERFAQHLEMVGAVPDDFNDWLHPVSQLDVWNHTGNPLPSLATPQGRDWLNRELDAFPAELIVIDTVRALMRHPEHSLSDEEGWRPCEQLLAELSAEGVSVFYLHHDGKSGDQLGTSAREFDPSYVLKMKAPKRAGIGWCRFRLEETKGRLGPTFMPREYVLEPDADGGTVWQLVHEQEGTKAERILRHYQNNPNATSSAIAETVGTTDSHVRSVISKARRQS